MSCSENPGSCTCGCCSGTSIETPQGEKNLPGLSAINYRTGTWAIFRESMLARLSSADYPALRRLKTRDTDDFSIALLDASAVVLDILTFYQERLANESYLRTAVQIRSLTELARLVGYQPAPGVSAETYLAFTLKAATGLPANPNTTAITIPAGTQVQNVPAQNQKPQYFETSADILAKPDWNALPVTAAIPWIPPGGKGLYLAGTTTHLNPGDALLILGVDRERWSGGPTPNEQWDVVILNQVNVDTTNNVTWAGWNGRLWHDTGSGRSSTVWTTAKIFAFRQRAALFGATAPDPNLFVNPNDTTSTSLTNLIDDSHSPWQWIGFESLSADQIYLDSIYSKIAVGSWLALDIEGTVQLFKAVSVGTTSLSAFGTSARITELAGDFADADVSGFLRRSTTVHAQSEQLTLARQPLDHPLYGTVIDIDVLRPDLVGVEAIAVFGKAQKLAVAASASPLTFIPDNGPDDGSENLTLNPGDIVTLIDPAPLPLNQDGSVPDWILHFQLLFHLLPPKLRVSDQSGRTGSVFAHLNSFTLLDSSKDDPDVQEFGLVSSVLVTTTPYPHTQILLKGSLANVYDRAMTTVNANVGLATAGRSVSEIMGSGSAATPNQRFTLRQSPLTYTQAPTPTGRQTTLTVTANDVKWKEVVPTLYEEKPSSTVYATLNESDGTTDVLFGDGVEGATLPTGQNNIKATYRVGSGTDSNVAARSISTLVDRPLGVSNVTNPEAANGGQDPQTLSGIRANAPSSVLTLGRAVSISDYQNFAANFGGIAKASALWIPSGLGRGVFLTLAGAGGAALPPGNPTLANLVAALVSYGCPHTPIHAVSFLETLFSIRANVAYNPDYNSDQVKARIVDSLRTTYSFSNRGFGQGVGADEIAALIQNIEGVVAVTVAAITLGPTSKAGDLAAANWSLYAYDQWLSQTVTVNRLSSGDPNRICPWIPVATPGDLPIGAEILVLDPGPNAILLGVLQ